MQYLQQGICIPASHSSSQMTITLSEVYERKQLTKQIPPNSTKKDIVEEFRKKPGMSCIKKHLHAEIYLVRKKAMPYVEKIVNDYPFFV